MCPVDGHNINLLILSKLAGKLRDRKKVCLHLAICLSMIWIPRIPINRKEIEIESKKKTQTQTNNTKGKQKWNKICDLKTTCLAQFRLGLPNTASSRTVLPPSTPNETDESQCSNKLLVGLWPTVTIATANKWKCLVRLGHNFKL